MTLDYTSVLNEHLSAQRIEHCYRVYEVAKNLERHYNYNFGAHLKQASLFHDILKESNPSKLKKADFYGDCFEGLFQKYPAIWHGIAAVEYLGQQFNFSNDVLNAIKYHTTGTQNMQLLTKVVFIADYIEPARSFEGLSIVREVVTENLDLAIYMATVLTMNQLSKTNQAIYYETVNCFNFYGSKLSKDELNYISNETIFKRL